MGDFNRFGKGYELVKKLPYDASKILAPNVTFYDPDFNKKKNVTQTSIRGKDAPNDNPQLVSTSVTANKKIYAVILFSTDFTEEFPPGSDETIYAKDFGIIHFDETNGFGYQSGANSLPHYGLKTA